MKIVEVEYCLPSGLSDLWPTIANVHTPEPARAIKQVASAGITQPHALARVDDVRTFFHVGCDRSQWMEQAVTIHVFKGIIGTGFQGAIFQHRLVSFRLGAGASAQALTGSLSSY